LESAQPHAVCQTGSSGENPEIEGSLDRFIRSRIGKLVRVVVALVVYTVQQMEDIVHPVGDN
jgi:hypothetical protein